MNTHKHGFKKSQVITMKDRLMYGLFVLVIMTIIMMIVSCDDEPLQKQQQLEEPPFAQFFFNVHFEMPSITADEYINLTVYMAQGHMDNTPGDEYHYLLSNKTGPTSYTNELPGTGELETVISGNTFTVRAAGTMQRSGTVLPEGTTEENWPTEATYEIEIESNHADGEITSATVTVTSETFEKTYDISEGMEFSKYDNTPQPFEVPEWKLEHVSDEVTILININDVYGTSIKN